MANFSHGHVSSASLLYPISIRAIDLVCPQAILPMRVTLFPSGMLCVTNIPSRNYNDTLLYSELNKKHAGESFMSQRFIVLKHTNVNIKNYRFRENLTFDPSKLYQILAKDQNTLHHSRAFVESNPLFSLYSTTFSFEISFRIVSPPPLHLRVMKSVHGRGLSYPLVRSIMLHIRS